MGTSINGQAALGQHLQPPVPLRGDLLERRIPHRGMRVADQGHRRRRGGIARRALRLSAFVGLAQAAVEAAWPSARLPRRQAAGCRFDGTAFELGRCRDRGLHLRERVPHCGVVGVDVGARGDGAAVMVSGAAGAAAADRRQARDTAAPARRRPLPR